MALDVTITLKAQATKAKLDKETKSNLKKTLCVSMYTINKVKRQPMEWEEIVANHMSDKG